MANRVDVVRAWKDPVYRAGLDAADRARTGHPSGQVEMSDELMKKASGISGAIVTTFRTCTEFTFRRFQCCK